MHLNLMEVVPVYFVSHSVDVKVMMYLLKNRALRDGLIDDPCIMKNVVIEIRFLQLHFLIQFQEAAPLINDINSTPELTTGNDENTAIVNSVSVTDN